MQACSLRAVLACYLMLLLAYFAGAIVPPLEGGSAMFADIALRIHEEGSWLQLLAPGQEAPSGPPLLFWLAAASFEVFGVNVVAYKLPALLFSVLAVYSTVRIGAILHGKKVGRLAGVILASSFGFLFANNDANMDALLVGSVVFATSQLLVFVTDENKLSARAHLVVAGAGLALGLAARGLVGVVLPLFAVLLYLVYRLEWRRLLDPFWLALPPLVLLFASPLLYAYHAQFGMDGLKFVLWLQSAERMASIGAGTEWPFYYCTYLWAFLPWSFLALWAFISGARRLASDRYWPRARGEALTLGVIVSVFALLSLSKFRLMYYVIVLLPFFALMLADWLPPRLRHPVCRRWLWRVQYVAFALVLDAALVFNGWMFPLKDWLLGAVVAAALLSLAIWVIPRWADSSRLVIVSVSVSVVFWLLANANIFPSLVEDQGGTMLGERAMKDEQINADNANGIFYFEKGGWSASFNFAVRHRVKTLTLDALLKRDKPTVLFVNAEGWDTIETLQRGSERRNFTWEQLARNADYNVAHPGWDYLNPNNRPSVLRPVYLLRVTPLSSSPQ